MMNGYESKREEKELDGIFCVKEQFFNDGILKITRYSVQNGDSKNILYFAGAADCKAITGYNHTSKTLFLKEASRDKELFPDEFSEDDLDSFTEDDYTDLKIDKILNALGVEGKFIFTLQNVSDTTNVEYSDYFVITFCQEMYKDDLYAEENRLDADKGIR